MGEERPNGLVGSDKLRVLNGTGRAHNPAFSFLGKSPLGSDPIPLLRTARSLRPRCRPALPPWRPRPTGGRILMAEAAAGAPAPRGPLRSPGYWLHHAGLAWRQEVETRLRPLGLTNTQFTLLASAHWLQNNEGPHLGGHHAVRATRQRVAQFPGGPSSPALSGRCHQLLEMSNLRLDHLVSAHAVRRSVI
jgi:hypothetical protein